MKHLSAALFIVCCSVTAMSQSVGIGTASPHASAMLEVSSTTKGLLAPRVTTAQRMAIASPAKGLLVYDTDLNSLYHHNGSAWAPVAGGGLTLPYEGSIAHAGAAFQVVNTGTGRAILGESSQNSTPAIQGNTNAAAGGYGVYGMANGASNFGIAGANPTGVAVYGFSAGAGTALRGVSTSGYALNTTGNIRMSGGNTNPVAGAVLTSVDVSGNAVWKASQIGFKATGIHASFTTIPNNTTRKMHFSSKKYDYGNNYNLFVSGTPSATHSTFTVPVNGLYHFDVQIDITADQFADMEDTYMLLQRSRGGNITTLVLSRTAYYYASTFSFDYGLLQINTDERLEQGDLIWVEVRFKGDQGQGNLSVSSVDCFFNGHLVFAD